MGEVDIRRNLKGWMDGFRMVVGRGQRWLERVSDGYTAIDDREVLTMVGKKGLRMAKCV